MDDLPEKHADASAGSDRVSSARSRLSFKANPVLDVLFLRCTSLGVEGDGALRGTRCFALALDETGFIVWWGCTAAQRHGAQTTGFRSDARMIEEQITQRERRLREIEQSQV
jgi:hypothetical protein